MDHIFAKVKGPRKKPFFKLVSDHRLFENITMDIAGCVNYNPGHNLDEDAWFKIEQFSQQHFCIELLQGEFDSKDYDDLTKAQFSKIAYLFSVQGEDFCFQKITPALFIHRKMLAFGEVACGTSRLFHRAGPWSTIMANHKSGQGAERMCRIGTAMSRMAA